MKGCYVYKSLPNHVSSRLDYVFGGGRKDVISKDVEMLDAVIDGTNLDEHKDFLKEIEVMFATWGMVDFTEEQIKEYFPNLKVVFYAAGSVQKFVRPFLACGVKVISAWQAMCVPVAEFTVASIVLLNKGVFLSMQDYYRDGKPFVQSKERCQSNFPGTYETKVGILGAGAIGAKTIEMLKAYNVKVMVYGRNEAKVKALGLGIERVYSLEQIFSECQVISNHIADNENTKGILNYDLFKLMTPTAAFLNTGRGAQVVEADLARALKEEPNRFAFLDVTWPEPMQEDCPLRGLPNCMVFPHLAGYATQEVFCLSDCVISEFHKYKNGEKMAFEVTEDMLEGMA